MPWSVLASDPLPARAFARTQEASGSSAAHPLASSIDEPPGSTHSSRPAQHAIPACRQFRRPTQTARPFCSHLVINEVALGRQVQRPRRPSPSERVGASARDAIPAAAAAACTAAATGGRRHICRGAGVGVDVLPGAAASLRVGRVLQDPLHNLLPADLGGSQWGRKVNSAAVQGASSGALCRKPWRCLPQPAACSWPAWSHSGGPTLHPAAVPAAAACTQAHRPPLLPPLAAQPPCPLEPWQQPRQQQAGATHL